jgi:putative membrane protein
MSDGDKTPSIELIHGDAGTELASNRTSLSFERTRMSADRTLMSTVRTSLSLISFGFTIYKVLGNATAVIPRASETARNVGLAMLTLGVILLVAGIASHTIFDRELGLRRERLHDAGLLRRAVHYHATPTYIAAAALLVIGLSVIGSIVLRLAS